MIQPNTTNLVRPRTIMPEPRLTKKKKNHSFIVLSLCGACMFLFILSVCLITSLVLVGKNLSSKSSSAAMLLSPSTQQQHKSDSISEPDNQVNFRKNTISKLFVSNSNNNKNTSEVKITSDKGNMAKASKIIDQLSFRLPRDIRPKLYELLLNPDLETKTFSGNVIIHLNVLKPTNFIAVHSKTLSITKTVLQQNIASNLEKIDIENTFEYPKYEYWITEVDKPLAVGEYVLNLTFNGSLANRVVGFYQSSYLDAVRNVTR